MTAAMAIRSNTASTFPIRYFDGGLEGDDHFMVERFPPLACVDIRPIERQEPPAKGRRNTKHIVVASRNETDAIRPDRTTLITCTGLRTRGGEQVWGSLSTGLVCDRCQKG